MLPKRNLLVLALMAAGLPIASMASGEQAGNNAAVATNAAQDNSGTDQASAQDNGTDTAAKKKKKSPSKLKAVEVTGFVSSIENSVATKRNSDEIVEAVSAEQIGQLPGISIADTLGRLPGLAVQTVSGRPQVLTIHGLGPDFSTAMVNGREQVSTSNNRDVQYDQYPASWFNSVVVHLSPTAGLVGQGLSGTVDMRTIRPLERRSTLAAVNAHYVTNSYSTVAPGEGVGDNGYKVNGVYVGQLADHTFGITLGVDFEKNPTQIQHQAPWGYPSTGSGDVVVGGSKNYGISDVLNRKALLTTFEYQPTENFTSTLDLTYDNFVEKQQAKGIEFPLYWGGGVTLEPGTSSDGFIVDGTYDNVKAVIRNDYNEARNKVYNIGWNNQFKFNDNWSATADASYSRANTQAQYIESYTGTGYGVGMGTTDTIGFTELPNGLLYLNPTLDYNSSQIVLTDPQGWGAGANPPVVQAGFINAPRTVDYLANLRLSVQRDFLNGPISNVVFGVDRGTRDKTYDIGQDFITLPDGAQTAPIPSEAMYGPIDPLAFMGIGPQVTYDPLYLLNHGYYTLFPTSLSSIAVPPNWHVRETDFTSFVQFNVDSNIGDVTVRGNFGLQVPHTSQLSQGQYVSAGNASAGAQVELLPIAGGTSYTKYLPSANFVFGFGDATDFRVGAARVMARPRMDQMSASIGLSTNITHLTSTDPNQSYFSASGGNAELLPTMADNYNLSLEHYFGENKGYASLSAYYLRLHDYINPNAGYLYDFSAYVDAYLTPEQQQQLGTTLGVVSGPTNDGHGNVRGLQGVLNMPLDMLTPYLDGFGVILSGDYTKSSLVYAGNPDAITVPGLSKWVINNTLYYKHDGFEARISRSYRDSFLGEVQGISATRILQTVNGGSTYDAQISYTIPDGTFKGLTVLLQGSNLTNTIFKTYDNNDPRQVRAWERYGRTYQLGFSYKFQ